MHVWWAFKVFLSLFAQLFLFSSVVIENVSNENENDIQSTTFCFTYITQEHLELRHKL